MTNGTQGSEVVCLRERSQAHVFEATEQQASCLEPSLDHKLAVVSSMDDDGRQGQPETAAEQYPRGFKDAKEQNNRGSNSAPWKRIMNKVRKSQKVSKEEPRDAVLLLFSMDACRFELLALQAISDTATVSDIFEHVSSCKEECLREQPYQGILSVHADTLITKDMNVAQCCDKKSSSSSNNKSNSILVAVPEGASVIECTRSAIQLLSDPVIIYNLELYGFDAKGWTTRRKKRLQFRSESCQKRGNSSSQAIARTHSTSKDSRMNSKRGFSWRGRQQSTTSSDTSDKSTASL